MCNDKEKLIELYGKLNVMENSITEEDEKSEKLIHNLKELNTNPHVHMQAEENNIEIPVGIIEVFNNLKNTIKLLKCDIEDEKVNKLKSLERYIDEFLILFNELQEEKDLSKKIELTKNIKTIYNNINDCMQS